MYSNIGVLPGVIMNNDHEINATNNTGRLWRQQQGKRNGSQRIASLLSFLLPLESTFLEPWITWEDREDF